MKIIDQKNPLSLDLAKQYLAEGKVICFATDTVYGVAVDATNSQAVARLYALKNRPHEKPVAIFVKNIEYAKKLFVFDSLATKIAQKHMPGKKTMILPTTKFAKKILAKNLNNGHNEFIGFRIIDSFFVRKLFENFDGILAVSSANKAFEEPCNSSSKVKKNLKKLDLLITGKKTDTTSSTIIKINNNTLILIRQGKIKIQNYEN